MNASKCSYPLPGVLEPKRIFSTKCTLLDAFFPPPPPLFDTCTQEQNRLEAIPGVSQASFPPWCLDGPTGGSQHGQVVGCRLVPILPNPGRFTAPFAQRGLPAPVRCAWRPRHW